MVNWEQMTDGLEAAIGVEAPPRFPCPQCGKESKSHGEPAVHDESERICSICRKVQPAPPENVPLTEAETVSVRFPCADCGRETKAHRSGRKEICQGRICTSCRHEFKAP